jgi:hypothetical protein
MSLPSRSFGSAGRPIPLWWPAQRPHLTLKALLQEDGSEGMEVIRCGAAGPGGWQHEMGPQNAAPRKGGLSTHMGTHLRGPGGAEVTASPGRAEPLDGRQHLIIIRVIL